MSHFIPQKVATTLIENNDVPSTSSDYQEFPDGTSTISRTWAKEFYLRNKRFLRTLRSDSSLRTFFLIWETSLGAKDLVAEFGSCPFTKVIHALVVDGGVFRLENTRGRHFSKLLWNAENPNEQRRPTFCTRDVVKGTPDRDDGTEKFAREWAKRFYIMNNTFLREAIRTRKTLTYFYKIWSHSKFSPGDDRPDELPFRPFNQVLFAMVNDGKICRVSMSRNGKVPLIVWLSSARRPNEQCRSNGMVSEAALDRAVKTAVEEALSAAKVTETCEETIPVPRPKSPPYSPVTPTTSPRPVAMDLPSAFASPVSPPTLPRFFTDPNRILRRRDP